MSGDDPFILAVLGAVHTFVRNYGTARVLLERAVALDPNAAWAWSRLGWLENYSDRPERAIMNFERALRLSPIDPMNFNNYVGIASAHEVAQDYDRGSGALPSGPRGKAKRQLDLPQSSVVSVGSRPGRRSEASFCGGDALLSGSDGFKIQASNGIFPRCLRPYRSKSSETGPPRLTSSTRRRDHSAAPLCHRNLR